MSHCLSYDTTNTLTPAIVSPEPVLSFVLCILVPEKKADKIALSLHDPLYVVSRRLRLTCLLIRYLAGVFVVAAPGKNTYHLALLEGGNEVCDPLRIAGIRSR